MKKLNTKAFILILILIVSSSDIFAQTRIRFVRGSTSATVSGTIGGAGGDWERGYVLRARYGQYLSANVSSRGGCVQFTENGTTSLGLTTRSGDNYIYLNNGCRNSTRFTLTVSISR
jgi:hypothetical protein